MVSSLKAAALLLAASAASVYADTTTTCDTNNKCPKDSPCCSQYGQCGVGAYCLGGCDPRSSFDLDSCRAAPVCQSGDFKLNSLDSIMPNTQYLGNASSANWVSSGTPVVYNDEAVLLTMAPSTVGTLLSSTHYVWYGKISATLTTSLGAGVVTAFIMMSDVKDEIDFEFVGVDLQAVQSNYYFQGTLDYDNEKNLSVANTNTQVHTYTIDWTPDTLTWLIDGEAMRTKNRNDTYNTTTGQYHYPQSPARIELSLWPAGLSSNGEGTIEWAGGLVDWDNNTAMANGYYYAMVNDVTVECYDPPSGYRNMGSASYSYMTTAGTNDTVAITNNSTELASFQATGDNPDYGKVQSASGTKSAVASATASANANTVPGVSGAGAYSSTGSDSSSSSNSDSSGTSSSDSSSSSSSSSGSSGSSFSQGLTTSSNEGARVVAGSLVALVAFFAAAMMM